MSTLTERDAAVERLRDGEKFLLTTHENPDGDALGSLLGMHLALQQVGKDSVMFMAATQFPLAQEYRHMPLDAVVHEPPTDMPARTCVFLDCGNIDRMPVDLGCSADQGLLNIDHHHDNTLFGTVNYVVADAACTAQIVYDLARELGVEITRDIADALYIGLVTDTGKFMFENTTPEAHQMAAELIDAGVQPQVIHRHLYEELPISRLDLLARALSSVSRYDDGAITMTHLTREDFRDAHATESDSEGIVDHMRQVEGTVVAALVRELLDKEGCRKVSLRATNGAVDVSAIAREMGGGGHRQAAGFTTSLPMDELVEKLRSEVSAQIR